MRVTGVKYELLRNFNANSQDLYESMCKLGDQVGQHGLLSGALQPTIVILDLVSHGLAQHPILDLLYVPGRLRLPIIASITTACSMSFRKHLSNSACNTAVCIWIQSRGCGGDDGSY